MTWRGPIKDTDLASTGLALWDVAELWDCGGSGDDSSSDAKEVVAGPDRLLV